MSPAFVLYAHCCFLLTGASTRLQFCPRQEFDPVVEHASPKFAEFRAAALDAPATERDRTQPQQIGRLGRRQEDGCSVRWRNGLKARPLPMQIGAHADSIRRVFRDFRRGPQFRLNSV